ncbi:MAG TPA: alpha/beta hydrolase family protein [Candidatus Binatia bacterium]|nr:alpha/beta hydrolase family protein [Candidatus Binatia bacterium]
MRFGERLLLDACTRFDRLVLDHFIRRAPTPPPPGLHARLERARAFYGDPRFIADPDAFFVPPRPIRTATPDRILGLPGGDVVRLDYETDFQPTFPEARADAIDRCNAHGVALWWRHARRGHPTMLCVHGYGGGQTWLESLAFEAVSFYRAGVDVVIYVLPYHGARTPAGARHSGELFFDMDLVRTNEAFARAIYELRGLARFFAASGSGPVGAFGMSLGAYTTALLATVEPLAFVTAMIPVVSFADRWWCDGEGDPWLAVALANGWSREGVQTILRVHEPLARPVRVPRDRLLVIGARGDGICTPRHAKLLWRHWGRPRIHWYTGGHLLQLGRWAALRDVRALVADLRRQASVVPLGAIPRNRRTPRRRAAWADPRRRAARAPRPRTLHARRVH